MTKLCESDWRSDIRLLNYTIFYSYIMNILILQVSSHTFHDFSIPKVIFDSFPDLENFYFKFHDFPDFSRIYTNPVLQTPFRGPAGCCHFYTWRRCRLCFAFSSHRHRGLLCVSQSRADSGVSKDWGSGEGHRRRNVGVWGTCSPIIYLEVNIVMAHPPPI